jgi:hypothetical protein
MIGLDTDPPGVAEMREHNWVLRSLAEAEHGLEKAEGGMTEDVSRRKALSLLGLGAALGFTLSSALEPSEAEAQEAAPAAAPAATTGTHGMNRRQMRRSGRHERRHTRRTGKPAAAAAPAGTTPAAPQ